MAKRAPEPEHTILKCTLSVDLDDKASQINVEFSGGERWSRSLLERMKKRADRELKRYKLQLLHERKESDGNGN